MLTLDDALTAGAPRAHRAFPGNVIARLELGAGEPEVEELFAAADLVLDDVYTLDPAPHTFLEPAAAIATWSGSGRCHVVSNAQCPHLSRRLLALILGIDEEQIDYESPAIGGSFGGKEEFLLDAAAALCSRAVGGRPVVLETDRHETTAGSRTRPGGRVRVRTGCTASGRITGRLIEATFACGPYAGIRRGSSRTASPSA